MLFSPLVADVWKKKWNGNHDLSAIPQRGKLGFISAAPYWSPVFDT